jgi:uncharacterized protein (DUF305 family)
MKTSLFAVALAFSLAVPLVFTASARGDHDATHAFTEVHKNMMQSMEGMKLTGDADKDFAMMMIPHHQGAIAMAEIELKYGKDPGLRKMAEEMIAAQKKEIEELKKWQTEHEM